MDVNTLLIAFLIFVARIGDVSIGTVRTIVTVQGRSVVAFSLAIFELHNSNLPAGDPFSNENEGEVWANIMIG